MKRKKSPPVRFVFLCVCSESQEQLSVRIRGRCVFHPKHPDYFCVGCFSFLRLELERFVFLWLVFCVTLGRGVNFLHSEGEKKAFRSKIGSVSSSLYWETSGTFTCLSVEVLTQVCKGLCASFLEGELRDWLILSV